MGDTFKGTWNQPGSNGRDRQTGRSMRELRDQASFDNEPQVGCGAMFLLLVLAVAVALGLALS